MVERCFDRQMMSFYGPGDAGQLAAAVLRLVTHPGERASRVERTWRRVQELSWDRESQRYLGLVERLAVDGRGPSDEPPRPVQHDAHEVIEPAPVGEVARERTV